MKIQSNFRNVYTGRIQYFHHLFIVYITVYYFRWIDIKSLNVVYYGQKIELCIHELSSVTPSSPRFTEILLSRIFVGQPENQKG